MIATTHMLVGAAAGGRVRSLAGALTIGALTHLLLDAVPHRDYRRRAWGGLALPADLAVGTASVLALSRAKPTALAGSLGGALPDALRAVEQATGARVTSWAHDLAHADSRPPPWASTFVQAAIALGAAAALAGRDAR